VAAPCGVQEGTVAVSKKRKTETYKVPRNITKPKTDNPKWLVPVMSTFLVLGPLWIVVYYVSGQQYPLNIGYWNIVIGFSALLIAMGLSTRWK
jgi:Cell division protein CrgA